MWTTDLSYGSLKQLLGTKTALYVRGPNTADHLSVDQCVKATTAFSDLDDMLDTQPHYAPKFCISRAETQAQCRAMLRAARAFNFAAERAGQTRRAIVF